MYCTEYSTYGYARSPYLQKPQGVYWLALHVSMEKLSNYVQYIHIWRVARPPPLITYMHVSTAPSGTPRCPPRQAPLVTGQECETEAADAG